MRRVYDFARTVQQANFSPSCFGEQSAADSAGKLLSELYADLFASENLQQPKRECRKQSINQRVQIMGHEL